MGRVADLVKTYEVTLNLLHFCGSTMQHHDDFNHYQYVRWDEQGLLSFAMSRGLLDLNLDVRGELFATACSLAPSLPEFRIALTVHQSIVSQTTINRQCFC